MRRAIRRASRCWCRCGGCRGSTPAARRTRLGTVAQASRRPGNNLRPPVRSRVRLALSSRGGRAAYCARPTILFLLGPRRQSCGRRETSGRPAWSRGHVGNPLATCRSGRRPAASSSFHQANSGSRLRFTANTSSDEFGAQSNSNEPARSRRNRRCSPVATSTMYKLEPLDRRNTRRRRSDRKSRRSRREACWPRLFRGPFRPLWCGRRPFRERRPRAVVRQATI